MNVSGVTYADQINRMIAKNAAAAKENTEKAKTEEEKDNSDEINISENYRRRSGQRVRNIAEMLSETGDTFEAAVENIQMKQSMRILNDEEFAESDHTSEDAEKWLDKERELRELDNSLDTYTKLIAKNTEQKLVLNRLTHFCFGDEKSQSGNQAV